MPSGVEGLANPLHELVLVSLGMPLLDNLDLDQLAAKRGSGAAGRFCSSAHRFVYRAAPDLR